MANLGRLNEGSQVKDLWAFSSDKFNGESQVGWRSNRSGSGRIRNSMIKLTNLTSYIS